MFLDTRKTGQHPPATVTQCRRSLSGQFVFLAQNENVRFAAEAAIDVLRTANRLTGDESYSWTLLVGENCLEQGAVCGPEQTLVLVGGVEHPWQPAPAYLRNLRSTIRTAARVCVVGAAVFVPLAAGVLWHRQVAVHPNFQPGIRETGQLLEMVQATTAHHKALSSAISPAAAIRMMVELVGARDGEFTRAMLARYLGLSDPDEETGVAEHWRFKRLAQGDRIISEALRIMSEHLEDTLTVSQIAELLEVSPRKLERGFRDLLGQTPLKVYRDLRLDRARQLLSQTSIPLSEVSVASGFSNVTLMKKWFVEKYGEGPNQIRKHAFGGVHGN